LNQNSAADAALVFALRPVIHDRQGTRGTLHVDLDEDQGPASARGRHGASHENAREPLHIDKPPADDPRRRQSRVSTGSGEHDSHHTRASGVWSKQAMSNKHPKMPRPTNVDLVRNPLIGGSKGVTMAQASRDDLEDLEGANTIEGDVENDTNALGGIDKAEVKDRRRAPPKPDRDGASRRMELQGRKTHEQQLRMLERKPDNPDSNELAREIEREQDRARPPDAQPSNGNTAPGPRIKGKGDGSGAMTDLQEDLLGENMVLSNRDKTEGSRERGQDGRWVETEQFHDHSDNKGRG
jgi:hypothetical protein